MDLSLSSDMAVRVALAVVLGGIIGLQREIDDQPAGLRTHLTVSLGAALFGVISTLGFAEFEQARSDTNINIDVTRVASQVVVGIGFLGAGVIIRRGGDVRNLTTAASLWATAAVGLAVGVGDAGLGMFSTAVLVIVLGVLRIPRDWVRRSFTRSSRLVLVQLAAGADADELRRWVDDLEGADASIVGLEKHDGRTEFRVQIDARPGRLPELCIAPLADRSEIEGIRFLDESDD